MDDQTGFEQQIQQGLAESAANRPEAALECFRAAARLRPSDGLPYLLIGSEHAACGDAQAAEQAFATAIVHAPGLHVARYQLGLLQFSSGRASIALLSWQPLLALDAQEPFGHLVQGFIALTEDRIADALGHWRQGLDRCGASRALAGDVARIIEAVGRLHEGADSSEPPNRHVLVAGYGRVVH